MLELKVINCVFDLLSIVEGYTFVLSSFLDLHWITTSARLWKWIQGIVFDSDHILDIFDNVLRWHGTDTHKFKFGRG